MLDEAHCLKRPSIRADTTMKPFFAEVFIWWGGNTWGTRLDTWLHGEYVGTDDQGNLYYRSKPGSKKPKRRWVIYNGYPEASKIPPGWHGWMHHRTDEVPGDYQQREWEKPHQANLTGSPRAYRPPGSVLHAKPRTQGTDTTYEPWRP